MAGGLETDPQKIYAELMILHERVFLLCLGFSKNPQDAEELTQETYLKAFRGRTSIKDPSLAREWLFRIARNTCLDHRKKKSKVRFVPLSETGDPVDERDPEGQSIQRERWLCVKRAVERLPQKLKDVFVLREYAELTYEEMAGVLKTNLGTVMSRLGRARRKVMDSVREAGDEHY